ncbi:MAG TPA: methyltransferase domain-containing protein [Armatimonadota bacterium]|nr:methyltransferase domain-containing protein [Armatimonadota bacterium]
MATYYVTVLGGLEPIAIREIEEHLPGARIHPFAAKGERGRMHFDYDGPPAGVLTLRSVQNIFASIAAFDDIPADESALDLIRKRLSECDLRAALAVHAAIHGPPDTPIFRCPTKRVGRHDYSSMQIMAAAGAGVIDQRGWGVKMNDYDYDIHADIDDARFTAGLKLSRGSLHNRSRVVHVSASLNQTLGYALCVLSDPQPDEVVVDITCGAGTLPIERAYFGSAKLYAGDIFRHPTRMSRQNFDEAGVHVNLCQWDARALPLASASVDKVLANLPWGRRAGSHTVNIHIYPAMTREIARVLRVGGRAVLLTTEKKMMTRCIHKHGWLRTVNVQGVSVGGLKPSIYIIEKFREHDPAEAIP